MGGGARGNFGTGVRVSILKSTPIIYPAFEKKPSLFIYLISQKVDLHIVFFELIYPFISSVIFVGGGGGGVRVCESVF